MCSPLLVIHGVGQMKVSKVGQIRLSNAEIYLVGSSSLALCDVLRFRVAFGSKQTQNGPGSEVVK